MSLLLVLYNAKFPYYLVRSLQSGSCGRVMPAACRSPGRCCPCASGRGSSWWFRWTGRCCSLFPCPVRRGPVATGDIGVSGPHHLVVASKCHGAGVCHGVFTLNLVLQWDCQIRSAVVRLAWVGSHEHACSLKNNCFYCVYRSHDT